MGENMENDKEIEEVETEEDEEIGWTGNGFLQMVDIDVDDITTLPSPEDMLGTSNEDDSE